jgi:hypothetical protein
METVLLKAIESVVLESGASGCGRGLSSSVMSTDESQSATVNLNNT